MKDHLRHIVRDSDRGPGPRSVGRDLWLSGLFKGIGSINLAFLTQTPKPPGEIGGGMANAIAGSVLILAIASLIGVPLGIGAGIYLAEFGRNRFGDTVRFVSDVLNGVPSIVIGIVAYALVVLRQKHFSALAGGVALAIMMIPTITRTTEEMLLLVPNALARSSLRTGRAAVAHDAFHRAANRNLRHHHRRDARVCPRGRARRRRCCLPPSEITSGIGSSISRPPLCRCRSSPTPSRRMMTGIGRRGRERWYSSF